MMHYRADYRAGNSDALSFRVVVGWELSRKDQCGSGFRMTVKNYLIPNMTVKLYIICLVTPMNHCIVEVVEHVSMVTHIITPITMIANMQQSLMCYRHHRAWDTNLLDGCLI